MTSDHIEHALGFFKNRLVLKSDHPYPVRFRILSFRVIVQSRMVNEMPLTIKFDRKLFRGTIEVENIVPDAVLSPEFASVEP